MLPFPPKQILERLHKGVVIPAHPLALNASRKLDERRQRALTRYYHAAGAGGIAVGVHTTQFEIREPRFGLYEPVLTLAAETLNSINGPGKLPVIRIAGVVGATDQALAEACLASDLGYHFGLVSLGAFVNASRQDLLDHLNALSEVIPIFGFYLQPAAGGINLDFSFWLKAVEIENLLAIKIAPFNRYQTIDVIRAVVSAGRGNEIALYTGNDDHIVLDLLSKFRFNEGEKEREVAITGGLLGHWACWTRQAVIQLDRIHQIKLHKHVPTELVILANQITDANAAIFDPKHQFAGCIPGIHEVLRRQGLLEGIWTLDPSQNLSPGQLDEIDRVYSAYPHLNDDAFVRENLDQWLA